MRCKNSKMKTDIRRIDVINLYGAYAKPGHRTSWPNQIERSCERGFGVAERIGGVVNIGQYSPPSDNIMGYSGSCCQFEAYLINFGADLEKRRHRACMRSFCPKITSNSSSTVGNLQSVC
jgi:hypothetical protein